jgi:predicted HicB family RNase H-like nuclease
VYTIYIIFTILDVTAKKNRGRVHVAKTIIIKNFPEELHRKAKAKAALEGITLKALIIKLLETYLEEFRT